MRYITRLVRGIATLFGVMFFTLLLASCGNSGETALRVLCDTLRSDYSCLLSYTHGTGEKATSGEAVLEHRRTVTELTIRSPEPLSGVSVEYDVKGSPSSVSVHFSGLDVTLPDGALGKINRVASLAADDFLSVLCKVGADKIYEYDISEDETGYYVTLPYAGAEITVFFSSDGKVPYRLEYISEEMRTSVVFTEFSVELGEG